MGIPSVLRHVGHDVIDCPAPPSLRVSRKDVDAGRKVTAAHLKECDAIVISGPEHTIEWLNFLYGKEWKNINVPKLGWYHESFVRPDYSLNIENFKPWVDEHFMPNPDDAEKLKGTFLPFGVDTDMFFQYDADQDYDVGFIGLLYEKRLNFLRALKPHLQGIKFIAGNVEIRDLEGTMMGPQTRLLADEYRRLKILLNLPSLSNVLVMKVLEAMASGTCVFTPELDGSLAAGVGFEHGKHLHYYDPAKPEAVANQLRELLADAETRARIAKQGHEEVHANHSLEKRLETILSKVGVAA